MNETANKTALGAIVSIINEAIPNVIIPEYLREYTDRSQEARRIVFGDYTPVLNRNSLKSIFNILNGNRSERVYKPLPINAGGTINFPEESSDVCDYRSLSERINRLFDKTDISGKGIDYYLERLESELTYIPGTLPDQYVSLYDQAKMCAAVSSCILGTMTSKEPFLIYSMDFSGIQDFLYTINSKGALKTLRARSFYLELLMENIIDDLLDKLELTRANLIYSGGGHCYLLLPNTEETKTLLNEYNYSVNDWLLNTFDIALYVGHGYASCSGEMLRNIPNGSYVEVFRTVSRNISERKSNRYSFEQIIRLNSKSEEDYSRECKVCRRIGRLNSDKECSICSSIKNFSNNILKDNYFCIVTDNGNGLPLPSGNSVRSFESVEQINTDDLSSVVRIYRKKQIQNYEIDSIGLWVGDYASDRATLGEMAADAKENGRIERIGVLRADVDNLGTAFSSGFGNGMDNEGSLMRTAALSRQLSLFFKCHINKVLSERNPNVTICYSGGDDLFIVGEWYDLLISSMDLRNSFREYTEGTLSLSGGIGIYDSKYPISRIAYETAVMEDLSKHLDGKDAVTIFEDNTYHWNVFEDNVIGEKLKVISDFFDNSASRGSSFLYKLLELIRGQSDRINFARYVYLLARLEPGKNADAEEKEHYSVFSRNMYEWINRIDDRNQLITAIQLYVYMIRNKEEK